VTGATVLLLATLAHLPLVEHPAPAPARPYFALLLTGDGGWRAIDAGITRELNRHGVSVVGLLSDDYFETAKTPEQVGRDVRSIIDAYAAHWKKTHVLLIGFSRGADAVPLALAHMDAATRARIVLAALLGPSTTAELQVSRFWRSGTVPTIALAPVVQSLHNAVPLLCVHGEDEDDSLCDLLPRTVREVRMRGGHHFSGDYDEVARAVLAAVPDTP
jgi:type IV secretory pathway VirJ component